MTHLKVIFEIAFYFFNLVLLNVTVVSHAGFKLMKSLFETTDSLKHVRYNLQLLKMTQSVKWKNQLNQKPYRQY